MANTWDPLGKRWEIDTVSSTAIDKNDLYVIGVRWTIDAGGAVGNVVTVTDPDGTTVLFHSVNTNGTTYEEADNRIMRWPKGFAVPALTVGKLYVYVR